MTAHLPPLRLTRARILRDGALRDGCVGLENGLISDRAAPEIDLSGYLVLPGIIDLHGDGFEHHMAPRPSAPLSLGAGLASFDREAAAHGVTTAFLAQSWSWEGGHRGPDHAEAVMQAVEAYRPLAMADLRVQIRAETHLVAETGRLIAAVERFGIGYVVFNNHLEEGLHQARHDPASFAIWARKAGKSSDALQAAIHTAQAARRGVPQSLLRLAKSFDRLGVSYGSHDDPDGETREFYRMIGARIAEFPLSEQPARAARATGSPVIMGAPNVVRGMSQAGNASATAFIEAGLCDALVSDYHIPALPMAVWALVDREVLGLAAAWEMISTAPAAILKLADRGRIEAGLRADLVVMRQETRQIEAVIAGGKLAYLSGEAGRRVIGRVGSWAPERVAAE